MTSILKGKHGMNIKMENMATLQTKVLLALMVFFKWVISIHILTFHMKYTSDTPGI